MERLSILVLLLACFTLSSSVVTPKIGDVWVAENHTTITTMKPGGSRFEPTRSSSLAWLPGATKRATEKNPTVNDDDDEGSSSNSCQDIHTACWFWAKHGECKNKNYTQYNMYDTCRKSCGYCSSTTSSTTTTTTTTLKPTEASSSCQDRQKLCGTWAKNGECYNKDYVEYLGIECRKSCGLCGDVTPPAVKCRDQYTLCGYWAKNGQCTDKTYYAPFMHTYCKKSCQTCDQVGATAGTTQCVDKSPMCGYWYVIGQCASNAGYMKTTCKRSCGLCKDGKSGDDLLGCRDSKDLCKYWTSIGECQRNPGFMMIHCRVSCKACTPDPGPGDKTCKDKHTNCKDWAKNGECTKNPSYMNETCPASCVRC